MEMTCVCFVPKSKRDKLRRVLQAEDTGAVQWSEKKAMFGSEFYFSGPSTLVRKAHAYITWWLAQG